jgi:pimeloyl-ACP methyl ester carboxylesterase
VRSLFATGRARLLARLALYGGFLCLGLPLALSQVLLGTVHRPVSAARPPWHELALRSDGLRLRAWLAPGDDARPAVVLTHGLNDSLESLVGSGELLHRRGHTALLLDLRAHGGSEGRYTTLGGKERQDVRAALAALRQTGHGRAGFVLIGASMGAVTMLRAAAVENDVRAVVAEAPYDDYRSTVAHHARLYYGLPGWLPLIPAAIALAEWRAGFDASEVSAVEAARRFRGALLVILDGADPRMPEPVVRRVLDAHAGPKRFWIAPDAPHASAAGAPGYWQTVLGFLEANGLCAAPHERQPSDAASGAMR